MIYLACPYSGPPEVVKQRMEVFCKTVAKLTRDGYLVVSPLFMHFVLPFDPTLGDDWKSWQRYSEELLSRCDKLCILCLDGWEESKGIQGEIICAESLGIKITKLPPDFAA
jgi:hypothetical protein